MRKTQVLQGTRQSPLKGGRETTGMAGISLSGVPRAACSLSCPSTTGREKRGHLASLLPEFFPHSLLFPLSL